MKTPTSPQRVAIVGAGMSGLSAARVLADAGHEAILFDKGRGVGGRTSLRRAETQAFDHGAQYFTARDPRFREFVDGAIEAGVAARWNGRIVVIDVPGDTRPRDEGGLERFVGVPGMNALAKHMAHGLDVRTGGRVMSLGRDAEGAWTVAMEDGSAAGGFDVALVTTPPLQAVSLLTSAPDLAAVASSVAMDPCWAAMVAFEEPFDVAFDGAFVNTGALSWACRNSSKPGRPEGDAWVLHATPDWTRTYLGASREAAADLLVAALAEAVRVPTPPVAHADAHRWMFSAAQPPRDDGALYDADLGLGVAGDWLHGAKVQGAWLSGRTLAERVLSTS